ncbi:MAG: DNA polymerase IV [Turicibacter sp.]
MEDPIFRIIFHIDLNAFFAACEMVGRPELIDKPVVITGAKDSKRGIAVTANYVAREFGIHSAMPIHEAKRRCPHVVVLKSNFDLYRAVSSQFIHILQRYSPQIEKASIDEAYLDVTHHFTTTHPLKLAQEIQETIYKELQIGCSIGIAPNKFLAKMASDMKKPNGITVLRKRDVQTVLWPLKIEEMFGVGKASSPKLHQLGIITIGDLAHYQDVKKIEQLFGKSGLRWKACANGDDDALINTERYEHLSSIGHSTTFPKDYVFESEIKKGLMQMCQKTSGRLRDHKVYAKTISLQLKYANFKSITRSQTSSQPIQTVQDLYVVVENLFDEHWNGDPVRLVGVSTSNLSEKSRTTQQLDLFNYQAFTHEEKLNATLLKLKNKHGEAIVNKGIRK